MNTSVKVIFSLEGYFSLKSKQSLRNLQRRFAKHITCVADLSNSDKLSILRDNLTCKDPKSANFSLRGFKHERQEEMLVLIV